MQRRQLAPLAGIGEGDVLEAEHRVGHHEVAGAGPVGDVRLAVEHLEQPRTRHGRAGERVDHQPELAHRHLQNGHEGEILGERADGDLGREHLVAADPQQEAHGEEEGIGHRGGVAHAQADPAVGELQRLL